MVRVRNLLKKTEIELNRAAVADYLQLHAHPRTTAAVRGDRDAGERATVGSSMSGTGGAGGGGIGGSGGGGLGGGSGGGGGGGGGGSGGGGGGGGGGGSGGGGGGGGGDPGNGTDDGGKADSPGDDMGTTNAAQHGGCSAVARADAAAPTWFFFAAAATLILRRRARAVQPIGRSGNIRKRLTCDREINAL
jgi:hypothetical protein